jgi:hypothetical protein
VAVVHDDDAEAVALLKVLAHDHTDAQRQKRKRDAQTVAEAKKVATKKESPKRRKRVDSSDDDDDDTDDLNNDPDFYASQESDASSDNGASLSDDGSDHEFEDGEQHDAALRRHHQPQAQPQAQPQHRLAVQAQPAQQAPRPAAAAARPLAPDALRVMWSPPAIVKPQPIANNRIPNKNADIVPFRQGSLAVAPAHPKITPLPKDAGLLNCILKLQSEDKQKKPVKR